MAYIAKTRIVDVPLAVDTNAYADGDVVGGLLTIPIADSPGGSGIIRGVVLVDDDNEGVALDLHLFNGLPSTIADNAAYAPLVADLRKQIGTIAIGTGDYATYNSNKIAIVGDTDIDFTSPQGVLYAYLVLNGAGVTYTAATDLHLRVKAWFD